MRRKLFKTIVAIVLLVFVLCSCSSEKEEITVSPVKIEIDGAIFTAGIPKICFEIESGNILSVKVQQEPCVTGTKKLSSKDCEKINELIDGIISDGWKNNDRSVVDTSDALVVCAYIEDEVYVNHYGSKKPNNLQKLAYKLVKESPIPIKILEEIADRCYYQQ
ncbi:MAG: hypothetical protein J6A69_03800 [Clostridia bacterium]|nr:hypothetical protein [Clostridia bacterium]